MPFLYIKVCSFFDCFLFLKGIAAPSHLNLFVTSIFFSVNTKYYFLYCWLVHSKLPYLRFFWVYLCGGCAKHPFWDFPTVLHTTSPNG